MKQDLVIMSKIMYNKAVHNLKGEPMDISYSLLRQNLKKVINQVADTHEPLFITSHQVRKAVVLSYEDYESLKETAYLLQNPIMATRLLKAVEDVKKKKVKKHRLIDET